MGDLVTPPTAEELKALPFLFGKNAPKRDMRTLLMDNYGSTSHISFPQTCAWERDIPNDPLGNDEVGDCAEAAPGHAIQNMTRVSHYLTPTQVTKQQVVGAYSTITGYNPSDPSTDQGSNMLDVCKFLQKTGLAGWKFDGYAQLNTQNVDQVKAAVFNFGWVYFGIVVPKSIVAAIQAGRIPQNWNYSSKDRETNNGHALGGFGYGRAGLAFNSWGNWYHMDWNFWLNWVDEAYVLYSKAWLKASGITPSGLDLTAMDNDINLVTQVN